MVNNTRVPFTRQSRLIANALTIMASSSDSDSNQNQHRRSKEIKYEFLWLEEKCTSTPQGKDWDQLNRKGRVKEISLTLGMNDGNMSYLIKKNFPGLSNANLTR